MKVCITPNKYDPNTIQLNDMSVPKDENLDFIEKKHAS